MIEDMPEGFEARFQHQLKEHIDNAFVDQWAKINTKESDDKTLELMESSKRVLFR